MSKKKFKAGLESLFGDPAVAGMSPFLVDEQKAPKESTRKKPKKRSSSKNFTSDLESLFSDTGNNAPEQMLSTSVSKRTLGIKKRTEQPIVGLDALIRRTIEENKDGQPTVASIRKRITITMDKKKLEELKVIAKEKKTYLRNIINELVSDFLRENKLQDGSSN